MRKLRMMCRSRTGVDGMHWGVGGFRDVGRVRVCKGLARWWAVLGTC